MRAFFLLFLSINVLGANKVVVDKIQKMEWDGTQYILDFVTLQKEFIIPSDSKFVPCLENAEKSDMAILLKVDQDRKLIEDCKLYSDAFPVTPGYIEAQAQQEKKLPKKILKR